MGIQFFEFQSFPINCLSIECLDSRLRGNDESIHRKPASRHSHEPASRHSHEPASRHSHESGNPVRSVSLVLSFG
ncbi:hypothetical protein COH79_07310 [Neisseria meningitidis]|nr:hypothetical protein COH79_07310 [Neisseria meningitidis]